MIKRTMKLLMALLLAGPFSLLAMENPIRNARREAFLDADFGARQAELRAREVEAASLEARLEMERMEKEMPDIAAERDAELLQDVRDAAAAKTEGIKWQNTLLTPQHWFMGLYKRDIPEFIKLAGDLGADVLMYKNLLKRREANTESYIKAHIEEFIKVLEEAKKAQEIVEKKYEEMPLLKRALISKPLLVSISQRALRAYIERYHRLIGFNPFTKDTIIPLAARFAWQKISDGLIDQLIEKEDWLRDDGWRAFKKDDKGNYFACKDPSSVIEKSQTPLSLVTLLSYMVSPLSTVGKNLNKCISYIVPKLVFKEAGVPNGFMQPADLAKVAHEQDPNFIYSYMGVPSWVFSPEMKLAAEFATLGLSAQMYDHVNNHHWIEYVVLHRDKLLEILKHYQAALAEFGKGHDEVKDWEDQIRKFVSKGHRPNSWIPGAQLRRWWEAMTAGHIKFANYLSYPVALLVGWNTAKLGYYAYNKIFAKDEVKNNNKK